MLAKFIPSNSPLPMRFRALGCNLVYLFWHTKGTKEDTNG
jgi:hypothetical protein